MKFTIATSTALILLTGVATAFPPLFKFAKTPQRSQYANLVSRQTITVNGTCGIKGSGAGHGFHCPTAAYRCCGSFGWCGDSAEYCGTGCQPEYGICTNGTSQATTPPTTPAKNQTINGTCGIKGSGAGNGFHCPTEAYRCCSSLGWCGDSAAHCATGCQPAYGICSNGTSTPQNQTAPTPDPDRPRLGSVPYGVVLNGCTVPGTVALAFDDGPYLYTQTLLNILDANGVKATFFVNGANWGPPITSDANAQQVLQNAYKGGHQIASHTWSHAYLDTLTADGVRAEMNKLESALLKIIGRYPTYMRPPYLSCGDTCSRTLNSLGYHIITTNLDTQDWQNNNMSTIFQSQNVFSNALSTTNVASGKWIILAHDVIQPTVDRLVEYMINSAKAKGYRLVPVGECLGDPAANWYRTNSTAL